MADIVTIDPVFIGSPAIGVNEYQLPSEAMKAIGDIINASWNEGLATKGEFIAKIAAAQTDFLNTTAAPHVSAGSVTVPDIPEPLVDIPTSVSVESIYDQWATEYLEVAAWLDTKFTSFRNTYFPNEQTYYNEAQSRISTLLATTVNAITAGSVTAPTTIEPSLVIDNQITEAEVRGFFSDTYASLVTLLEGKHEAYRADNFPNEDAAYAALTSKLSALCGTSITDLVATTVNAPTVVEPTVTVPASIDTSGILALFTSTYNELVALLETKFQEYGADYFANDGVLYDSAEAWLQSALNNPAFALPPSVVTQVWGDDQARILSDKVRAQDAVMAQFASRRFPLPPDAAASAILQIEQKAQDEIAESSRKAAIMAVELLQKAIDKAVGMRQASLAAANEYIKALASGPDVSSRIVGLGLDAQSKLISSVASLLNARTEVAKLTLTANTTTAQIALDTGKANQIAKLEQLKVALERLLALRQTDMQVSNDYMKAINSAPETASRVIGTGYDAQMRLISSVASLLGARVEVSKLQLAADTTSVQIALEAAKANQQSLLEQLKLAVNSTVSMRENAMKDAIEYVKALASAPEMTSRLTNIGYDAQSKLISSVSQYYNARTQAKEVMSKVNQYNNSTTLEAAIKNQSSDLTLIEDKLKALLAEATALAQMSTAFFNNLHTGATMSVQGSTSGSIVTS